MRTMLRCWALALTSLAASAAASDRDALMALYEETGGDSSWLESRHWGSSQPIGNWHGVEVDAEGRVVALELAGNGLHGPLVPEIVNLERLRRLNLPSNRLVGRFWPDISRLRSLVFLNMHDNRVHGPLPQSIGDLVNLEWLDLSSNVLSGEIPSQVGRMKALRHLDLRDNRLQGWLPRTLGNLQEVTHLIIGFNQLVGKLPGELGNMAKLNWLDLSANRFQGELPPELFALPNLFLLSVSGNHLEGEIPAALADLGTLEHLNLAYNRFAGPIPAFLGHMNLHYLDLKGNRLEGRVPESLGRLNHLTNLQLGGNQLTGRLPRSMVNLDELHRLDLGGDGLCVDADDVETKRWLRGIDRVDGRLANCPNPHPLYLVQSVQSFNAPVTLVAGRSALLRVFLSSPESVGEPMPAVRAAFYDAQGNRIHVARTRTGAGRIPKSVAEGDLSASANIRIPGHVIQPGVEMAVEVVNGPATLPARIPDTGRIALDVEEMPRLELTLVPILWEGEFGSSPELARAIAERGETHPMLRPTRDLLPVERIDVTAHAPVTVDSGASSFRMLLAVGVARHIAGGSGYWMGLGAPEFTSRRVKLGLGWEGEPTFYSDPHAPTMAHELGHNMSLSHTPCGGARGFDWYYPDPNALVGAWGWDEANGILVSPSVRDHMSYCDPSWTGEYGFSRAMRFRLTGREDQGALVRIAKRNGRQTGRTLLLSGGVNDDGSLYLKPPFEFHGVAEPPPSGAGLRLSGRDEYGEEVFSVAFDMPDLPDSRTAERVFVMTVPATWSGRLHSIKLEGRLRGLDGRMERRRAAWDRRSRQPMTILRDQRTGEVRAVLERSAVDALEVMPREVRANLVALERLGAAGQ